MLEKITLLLEVLALFIGFLKYKYFFSKFMQLLLILLGANLFFIVLENIVQYFEFSYVYSYGLNLLSSLVSLCITYFLYLRELKSIQAKQIIKISGLLFLVACVASFFIQGVFHSILIYGAFIISLLLFFYFKQLITSEKVIEYEKMLSFWVAVAFFIVYSSSIPVFYLVVFTKKMGLFKIIEALIIVQNVIVIFGLLWSKKSN